MEQALTLYQRHAIAIFSSGTSRTATDALDSSTAVVPLSVPFVYFFKILAPCKQLFISNAFYNHLYE